MPIYAQVQVGGRSVGRRDLLAQVIEEQSSFEGSSSWADWVEKEDILRDYDSVFDHEKQGPDGEFSFEEVAVAEAEDGTAKVAEEVLAEVVAEMAEASEPETSIISVARKPQVDMLAAMIAGIAFCSISLNIYLLFFR